MKFLTIIPARAGSKGIKNKNFINFLGKPLIEHTLTFAKKLKNNNIIISSDSKKTKKLSKKYKTITGYERPKKLSKDNVLLKDTFVTVYMFENDFWDEHSGTYSHRRTDEQCDCRLFSSRRGINMNIKTSQNKLSRINLDYKNTL